MHRIIFFFSLRPTNPKNFDFCTSKAEIGVPFWHQLLQLILKLHCSVIFIYSLNTLFCCFLMQAVSGKDAPLNNFFFFDGVEGHGTVECFTLELL